MMKRILYILLIAGALATIVYVYLNLGTDTSGKTDPWTLVPGKASVVVSWEAGDAGGAGRAWLAGYQRSDDDTGFPALLAGLQEIMAKIDSLHNHDAAWAKWMGDSRILAYNRSAVTAESWAVVIPVGELKQGDLTSAMSALTGASYVQSEVDGAEVFSSADGSVSATSLGGCVIASLSGATLEDAIRNRDEQDAGSKRMLERVKEQVAMDSPVNLFFRDENDWWHFDLVNVEGAFQLAGFIHLADSSANLVSLAGSGGIPAVIPLIPAHTELFEVRNYADFNEGWQAAASGKVNASEEAYWSRAWGDIGDSCSCDLNEAILNWRSGEWGSFAVPFNGQTYSIEFVKASAEANPLGMLRPVLAVDSLVESGYSIYPVRYPEAFERNARRYFSAHAAYVLVYGGYVFTAPDPEALRGLIRAIVDKDTWDGMALWQDAFQKLGNQSGQLYFQDLYSISLLPESFVNCFGNARPIVVSISRMRQDMFRANVLLGAGAAVAPSGTTPAAHGDKWTVRLGNKVKRAPQLVKNHKTTGFDVVVQTEDNFLRCIDAAGSELWSRQLDGPVIGKIGQLDALRNEKLQMAFVAGQKLYVIDRNGNDLSGFPVQLKSAPVTGINILDYESNRNYRLMAALTDGSVCNYTVDATLAQGWVHQPGKPVHAITHVKVGSDDILVMVHEDGTIRCFKRNGQLRYEAQAVMKISPGGELFCQGANRTEDIELCALDGGGALVRKRLGSDIPLKSTDVGAGKAQLTIADLNGDRVNELILTFANAVQVHKSNTESIMRFESAQPLSGTATVVMSGKEKGLLVTLADGTCKLIDMSGNVKAEMKGESVLPMVAGDLDLDGFLEYVGVRADEIYARGMGSN